MAKITKPDGTVYYYYYKKKKGRHKKTGPKKLKVTKKGKKGYDGSWNFKIIRFDFRKQAEYIDKFRTLYDVQKKKEELLKKNDEIEIPVKYINNQRKSKKPYELRSEYVVLKKIKEGTESNESMLRNEYGKLVKHVTTGGRYYVYDKFPCLTEETFWVYGFNPKTDRKTCNWIYTNMIEPLFEDIFAIINIYVYNNKVILMYNPDDIDFIICKNKSDAIRLYNFLSKKYDKNRQVVFTGSVTGHSGRGAAIINLIREKTGWDLPKIYKTNTVK